MFYCCDLKGFSKTYVDEKNEIFIGSFDFFYLFFGTTTLRSNP